MGLEVEDVFASYAVRANSGDQRGCMCMLQAVGWELTSSYLNGGLGRGGWQYPLVVTVSNALADMGRRLSRMWSEYAACFGSGRLSLVHEGSADVADMIACHYRNWGSAVDLPPAQRSVVVEQVEVDVAWPVVRRMVDGIRLVGEHLVGYWLHGSVGSHDVKRFWSDVDGLAIVKTDTLLDPFRLRQLRRALIDARRFMSDFMPFQLHGHFVICQPDLASLPDGMFPSVLFSRASCVFAGQSTLPLRVRRDPYHAMQMLWKHGIKDLLCGAMRAPRGTVERVVFLHRTYLLPCLVAQALDEPMFKGDVFQVLRRFFTESEAGVIERASRIWFEWEPPPLASRVLVKAAWITRWNPILYQKASLLVGDCVPWLRSARGVDWAGLAKDMSGVAKCAWDRVRVAVGPEL